MSVPFALGVPTLNPFSGGFGAVAYDQIQQNFLSNYVALKTSNGVSSANNFALELIVKLIEIEQGKSILNQQQQQQQGQGGFPFATLGLLNNTNINAPITAQSLAEQVQMNWLRDHQEAQRFITHFVPFIHCVYTNNTAMKITNTNDALYALSIDAERREANATAIHANVNAQQQLGGVLPFGFPPRLY